MNLKDKLFWDVAHYKVHVPSGQETLVSAIKGVPQRIASRIKLKAQRNGYRYNRAKHVYVKVNNEIEHHLIFS